MRFGPMRLVANDIQGLVDLYELVTAQPAEWLSPIFAEISTPSATLALRRGDTDGLFEHGRLEPASNQPAFLEFMVDDVDAEFARLRCLVEVVHEPQDMPSGDRMAQFRDSEGTAVALYTPVTEAAKLRVSRR
jgi:predicted enzyme related to lactoylglutathione lyase